jgi:hypothetical protein
MPIVARLDLELLEEFESIAEFAVERGRIALIAVGDGLIN